MVWRDQQRRAAVRMRIAGRLLSDRTDELVGNLRQLGRTLPTTLAEFYSRDLRWSYLAIGAMIIVATVVNLLFSHGWTVWPFMFSAGVLFMVHEAAERNGEGVPPLHVYGLLIGCM